MSIEYSGSPRGSNPFPKHWRGIDPGQTSEERAAMIIVNMALDLEARGDHAGAAEVRQGFVKGRGTGRDSERTCRQRWVENPTAVNALAYARSITGT